jgi:hypothetical protein
MGKRNRRISAGALPVPASTIRSPAPPPAEVLFSFKHLQRTDKFRCDAAPDGYAHKLTERLGALSASTIRELTASRASALRFHPITWGDTTEPEGFALLNPQLRDLTPYQFAVSANEHGRVHGFVIGAVFYVVWLDPHHRLYAAA